MSEEQKWLKVTLGSKLMLQNRVSIHSICFGLNFLYAHTMMKEHTWMLYSNKVESSLGII